MIKESFILFTEFRESFNELSNEEAGILIKAIFDYTATGIEPKLDKLLKLVFIPIKQCIDRNSQNYETIKNARSEAGKKGMEKRWKNKENNNDNKNNKNDFVIQDSNINNQEDIEDNNKITNYNKNNKAILLYNNDNKNNLYVDVDDDVSVDVDDSVLLSPLTPQGEIVEEKNQNAQIPKNLKNDFIDYQFVEDEYKKGDFDFDLVKFWTYWKDKGLRQFELSNKFIIWEIKDREKKKVQNITEKLVKQMKVNNELKYRQDIENQQENDNYI